MQNYVINIRDIHCRYIILLFFISDSQHIQYLRMRMDTDNLTSIVHLLFFHLHLASNTNFKYRNKYVFKTDCANIRLIR